MELFTPFFIDNGIPLYEQLYTYIKEKIIDNHFLPKEKLPSKRKLSLHLNISQNTIQRAYDQLQDEGYIYGVERSGYFIEKIDWMKPIKKTEVTGKIIENSKKNEIVYDFSFNSIDKSAFPIKDYQRLYKKSLQDSKLFETMVDPQGYLPLRDSISKYLLSSRGVDTSPQNIIISSGTEYLYSILFRILPKTTIYGLENPGYERVESLLSQVGLYNVPINIAEDGINISDLNSKKVNCMTITPSHQFPTGIIYPMTKRQNLLAWAKEADNRWIIEDDYDSEFRYRGKPIPALKGFDTADRVIYLGSFSKSFSPALRISYMVLPSSLMKAYINIIDSIICPVPTLTQHVFHLFMNDGLFTRHLNRMRTIYSKKRELLIDLITKSNLPCKIKGTDAGLHIVLSFPDNYDEDMLVESAKKCGCNVYGMRTYYSQTDSSKPHIPSILIGYGSIPIDAINDGCNNLIAAWTNLIGAKLSASSLVRDEVNDCNVT